jgi:hypothetical protein
MEFKDDFIAFTTISVYGHGTTTAHFISINEIKSLRITRKMEKKDDQ